MRRFGIPTLKDKRMKSSSLCLWMHSEMLCIDSDQRLMTSHPFNCSVFFPPVEAKLCHWGTRRGDCYWFIE